MSFLEETKRRKVFQVAAVYAVVAWLLVQIVATVETPLSLPDWVDTLVIVLLAVGFPITVIMSWAFNLTAEGLVRDSGPSEKSTGRTIEFVLIGLLVIAVGWLVYRDVSPSSDVSADNPDVLPNSVAVLPLDNLSPNPDNAYIAAGLHEEILNQLAKISALNVIARTSVLPYAENRPPIAEIAQTLNVGSIMEGSVRYAGDRIRVTTQLIDSVTGAHLWSETYDREFDDIFAIESDIAISVANALEAELSDQEQQRVARPPTDSPAAYALVLRARALIGVGDQIELIHELLDQAIRLDPQFTLAHGMQAGFYAGELINTSESAARSRAELEPLVRDHVERALTINPEESAALEARGILASQLWRWAEAAEAFDQAYATGTTLGGHPVWFRAWAGDQPEALSIALRQVTLSPLDWLTHFTHGIIRNYARDYEAASAQFREGIGLSPTLPLQHSWLAISEAALGNTRQAREALELAEGLLGENRVVISLLDIAYGYGRIGDTDDARRLFDEISAAAHGGADIGTGGRALMHLAIRDTEQALDWLERAAEKASRNEPDAGYFTLMNIKMNYAGDPILERPEFVDVRNRLRGD